MQKQRQAVCETILSVLSERGVDYELNSSTPIKEVLTPQDKQQIRELIKRGFKEDRIEMSESAKSKYSEDKALNSYVSGLVNNWVNKAPEFNCGVKYKPANPGSRAGSHDEQIRAMRLLKKQTSDPQALAEIDKAISERLAEIKPQQQVDIDVKALPSHLRYLVD